MLAKIVRRPVVTQSELEKFPPSCFGHYSPKAPSCRRCLLSKDNTAVRKLLEENAAFFEKHYHYLDKQLSGLFNELGAAQFIARRYTICRERTKLIHQEEK